MHFLVFWLADKVSSHRGNSQKRIKQINKETNIITLLREKAVSDFMRICMCSTPQWSYPLTDSVHPLHFTYLLITLNTCCMGWGGMGWDGRPRLRSASTHCILLPRVQTSTGQRSFAYRGPAVWNSLPPALCENTSLATFKTKLKTYLFRRSQWLLKTIRRCCSVFAISAPRYKWLYLLTYLLNIFDVPRSRSRRWWPSYLFVDTDLVKFSWRFDGQFVREIANKQTYMRRVKHTSLAEVIRWAI